MKKYLLTGFIILIFSAQNISAQSKCDSLNLKKHLLFLASDQLKGRFPGSKEDTLSMNYIFAELERVGFKPYFKSDFLQFSFVKSREASDSRLLIMGSKILRYGIDYEIPPFSGDCDLTTSLITTGRITNENDFKKGDAVLVKSTADDIKLRTTNFADKGASIIFFYNPDEKGFVYSKGDLSAQLSIPVVYLSADVVKNLKLDSIISIRSKIYMKVTKTKSADIVMKLNVKNPKGDILIGAHYDHLGYGEYGSRTPSRREIYNGADDNASGVASIVEIGRIFAKNQKNLEYNIIIAAFGAEEKGLLGSKYLVDTLKKQGNLPLIMFNLDMVGRLSEDKLQVGGTGTFLSADSLVSKINESYGFKISQTRGGTGSSDHSSFYSSGVPVLYFTTGVHPQYHTPDDDVELINFDGMAKVCNYVYDISSVIADGSFVPQFTKVAASEEEPVRTSFKVTLGVVPDFTYEKGDGFRIGAVTEGKPASKAGLISGDIITSMNGKGVKNIYEYMARLGELKAGDIVDVSVNREGNNLNFKIQL